MDASTHRYSADSGCDFTDNHNSSPLPGLPHHLGYAKLAWEGKNTGDLWHGVSPKPVKGRRSQVEIDVSRDRNNEFKLQLMITLGTTSKTRVLFPGDEAAFNLLYFARRNISQQWTKPVRE